MPISGSKLVEYKIDYFSSIGHEMYSEIPVGCFKEIFFLPIKDALVENHYNEWRDVEKERSLARKQFFDGVLLRLKPHFKNIGIAEDKIEGVVNLFAKKTKRYFV